MNTTPVEAVLSRSSGASEPRIGATAASGDELPDPVWLRDSVRTISRLYRTLECSAAGLTLAQYRVLGAVGAGGERSARLAEKLAIRRPTLTAAADALVAAGHLERETDPADRRVVRLCLTTAGRRALEETEASLHAAFSGLLTHVSDPPRLIALLAELDDAFTKKRQDSCESS